MTPKSYKYDILTDKPLSAVNIARLLAVSGRIGQLFGFFSLLTAST